MNCLTSQRIDPRLKSCTYSRNGSERVVFCCQWREEFFSSGSSRRSLFNLVTKRRLSPGSLFNDSVQVCVCFSDVCFVFISVSVVHFCNQRCCSHPALSSPAGKPLPFADTPDVQYWIKLILTNRERNGCNGAEQTPVN